MDTGNMVSVYRDRLWEEKVSLYGKLHLFSKVRYCMGCSSLLINGEGTQFT